MIWNVLITFSSKSIWIGSLCFIGCHSGGHKICIDTLTHDEVSILWKAWVSHIRLSYRNITTNRFCLRHLQTKATKKHILCVKVKVCSSATVDLIWRAIFLVTASSRFSQNAHITINAKTNFKSGSNFDKDI